MECPSSSRNLFNSGNKVFLQACDCENKGILILNTKFSEMIIIVRNVWQTVRRTDVEILGVKGLTYILEFWTVNLIPAN